MQIPLAYELFFYYCLTAVSSPFLLMQIQNILVITHQNNINTNMQWLDVHQCIIYINHMACMGMQKQPSTEYIYVKEKAHKWHKDTGNSRALSQLTSVKLRDALLTSS